MNIPTIKAVRFLLVTASALTLGACGWVDSTGTQGATLVVETPVVSGGALRNAQPLAVTENTTVSVSLTGEGSQLNNWLWNKNSADESNRCLTINGFDINHAATTLEDACSNKDSCSIDVEEIATASTTEFKITMPQLRAPVALSYNISTTREDGAIVTRQQTLCGVSVNEAPVAENDDYVINRQSAKVVVSTDLDSLLYNDYDDDDVRNSALTINTTPVVAPIYASQFTLGHDGGFLYQPAANLPVNSSGFTEDSFVYSITDGIHTVEATAIIKIIGTNESPEQTQQIPDTIFASSNGVDDSHLRQIDLAQYFVDPDGDKLTFTIDETSLDFGLFISNEGVLRSNAGLDNVNQWRASVTATDGIESISARFVVTVRESDSLKDIRNNNEPTAGDIRNSTFSGEFEYDVSVFFDDKDNLDKLTFTAVGLPSGTQIRADGVIEGEANSINEGRWFVRVTAEDGFGGNVNDGFMLILK